MTLLPICFCFSSELIGGIHYHYTEKQSNKRETVKAVMYTVEQVHMVNM